MNSYMPLGTSIFYVGKLRNSPAITCASRLESEYPASPPTSSRVIQRFLRSQFEAVVRAFYFHECASENEVESFANGKSPISLKKMTEKLEVELKYTGLFFLKYYENTGEILHGFTHGGFEQIGRRYSDSELINSFKEKEVKTIVSNSHILACLSASCASAIAGNDDLATELISKYGKYKKET